MRNLNLARLFVMLLVLTLAACATTGDKPAQELTPLQDAYVVRDSIIIAKKGLNDAYALNKLTQTRFDELWATAEQADRIVSAQIASAHSGLVVKNELTKATKKVEEVNGALK